MHASKMSLFYIIVFSMSWCLIPSKDHFFKIVPYSFPWEMVSLMSSPWPLPSFFQKKNGRSSIEVYLPMLIMWAHALKRSFRTILFFEVLHKLLNCINGWLTSSAFCSRCLLRCSTGWTAHHPHSTTTRHCAYSCTRSTLQKKQQL